MSTILVDNLTGKTSAGDITVTSEGGAATQSLQQGLAKAWVNFDGTGTIAARDSLNNASLTDNGTGDYSVGYTNSFANDDYCGGGSASIADNSVDANAGIVAPSRHSPNVAFTTSSSRIITVVQTSTSSQYFDEAIVCWEIKGDLA